MTIAILYMWEREPYAHGRFGHAIKSASAWTRDVAEIVSLFKKKFKFDIQKWKNNLFCKMVKLVDFFYKKRPNKKIK